MRYVLLFFEVMISMLMVLGGVSTGLQATPRAIGLAALVGADVALFVWGALFFMAGLGVLYGIITKQPLIRTHSLMGIYMLCLAAFLGDLLIDGWTVNLIDSVVIGLTAAVLWMVRRRQFFYAPIAQRQRQRI